MFWVLVLEVWKMPRQVFKVQLTKKQNIQKWGIGRELFEEIWT